MTVYVNQTKRSPWHVGGRAEGSDRYLVYTRWRAREDFEAWMQSTRFAAGHRQHAEGGPVSRESEVWEFEVLQAEYAGT